MQLQPLDDGYPTRLPLSELASEYTKQLYQKQISSLKEEGERFYVRMARPRDYFLLRMPNHNQSSSAPFGATAMEVEEGGWLGFSEMTPHLNFSNHPQPISLEYERHSDRLGAGREAMPHIRFHCPGCKKWPLFTRLGHQRAVR